MKESYGKDPASHPDPLSCAGGRKDVGEALTGAHVGQPSSCEIRSSGVPTRLSFVEGINNKIRVIERRAYGIRDEEYLRLKILTCMLLEI